MQLYETLIIKKGIVAVDGL